MRSRHLVAIGVFLFIGGEVASANSFVIPNHHRGRRETNHFSAIGWSDRKEVGARLTMEKSKTDYDTENTFDQEQNSTEFGPHIFYRLPINLNVEAEYTAKNEDLEYSNSPTSNRKSKSNVGSLGLGYELTGIPMAFGVHYNRDKSTSTRLQTGSRYETKRENFELGVGYRLENQIYLGAGWTHTEADYDSTSTSDDKYDSWMGGVGKVFGDSKRPDATVEGLLSFSNHDGIRTRSALVSGLYNYQNWQFTGAVVYGKWSGTSDFDLWNLMAGLDWQIADFYLGPQLSYTTTNSSQYDSDSYTLSMEGGYRIAELEVYLRFTPEQAKVKFTELTNYNYKETGQTWQLGASYMF